ncbi:MAG: ATP-binding cassette domain-containing protein [Raoultibacter sp.]|jgi:peptide/nickel transport system ATP-binding protein
MEDVYNHKHSTHERAQKHHGHSHAHETQHLGGHHLITVEDLSIGFTMYDREKRSAFRAPRKQVSIINNLNLSVHAGEILALVGASGSGKTLLADTLMGMFEPNVEVQGRIWFDGEVQDANSLARLRGQGISLVPQSITHLNPLMRIGKQVRGISKGSTHRVEKQRELFRRYNLDESAERLYPHQISGGMARRILLISALIDDPRLIIADEPTPGLDLDLAVKAMEDFREFAGEGKGVLLITHDIELALRVADRVAVFKDGTVVEETAVQNFSSPDLLEHPFSKELWHALPEHDFSANAPSLSEREDSSC